MIRTTTIRPRIRKMLLSVAMGAMVLPAMGRPTSGRAKLPNTSAGRRATAFFKAFNSGNDDSMRSFERQHRAKSALKRRSIDERIEQYHELRADWGDLKVDGVFDSKELELSLGVNATETDDFLQFRFELEPDPPHGLVAIYIEAGGPRPVRGGPSGPMTDAKRRDTVKDLAEILDRSYVFPEVGTKMANMLRDNLAAGKYESAAGGPALARRLTSDLADICHDKHLRVVAGGFPADEHGKGHEDDGWWAQTRRKNYGFERVELLAGNVGYVKLNQFSAAKEAEEVAAGAMSFLANTDALIFDLRQNGGGSPEMIAFLSGYLFDESVHLNSFYHRKDNKTTETWSRPSVPGRRYGSKKPVYVLTSDRTFSAAEEFTYNLKHLKRATIVGETTGGGAHPVERQRINDSFAVTVPFARAINPITKTNWERVGVKSQIDVPASQALLAAHKDALERLLETGLNGEPARDTKAALRRITADLKSSTRSAG